MIEGLLIAQLLATFLRGRGPFPLLRKACASLFASPPTAESRLNVSQWMWEASYLGQEFVARLFIKLV